MNDRTFTNKLDIAEEINKYFIGVRPSLASIIDHYDEEPTKYINKSQVSSLICPLSRHHKFVGFFKIASEPLSLPFTYIYKQSIANCIVPDVFKISIVTPIYKSGEATDTGNYRPIATLSSFS